MTADAARPAKAEWRARLLARRAARPPGEIAAAGAAIAATGRELCRGARTVAAYLATPDEPPTEPLLAALRADGIEVLLPVIDGDRLDWVADGGTRRPGRFGIAEPVGTRLGPAAVCDATVVFVPALAVDRRGVRLGRGRGYYDRALALRPADRDPAADGDSAAGRLTVAVGYDDELVDRLPAEPHDVPVDAVLSPAGWQRLR